MHINYSKLKEKKFKILLVLNILSNRVQPKVLALEMLQKKLLKTPSQEEICSSYCAQDNHLSPKRRSSLSKMTSFPLLNSHSLEPFSVSHFHSLSWEPIFPFLLAFWIKYYCCINTVNIFELFMTHRNHDSKKTLSISTQVYFTKTTFWRHCSMSFYLCTSQKPYY